MIQRLTIPGRFCSLNEFYRAHYQVQGRIKKENDALVAYSAKAARLVPRSKPVEIRIHWYEMNRRRDLDNIHFGVKFILDGLVKAGVLHGDSPTYVKRITHEVSYDHKNPRIEVEIHD